jgi:hypothetical protein
MKSKARVPAIVALALVVGAGVGAWYELRERPPVFCELSGRPIHANMLTIVRVDGKRLYTCCARCPLTFSANTHHKVEILEVTDYATGKRLRARDAYFVDGSRMEMCSTPRLKFDADRTPYVRLFDRCSPSLLTFGSKADAQAFMEVYGGRLQRLNDLMPQTESPQKVTGER